MRYLTKTAAVLTLLVTAACTSTSGGFLGGGSGSDISGAGIGSIDETSLQYFESSIGSTVLFAVNESSLSGENIAILNAQAGWLATNPTVGVLIEGHADEQGTREYNIALGSRRASSVRDYLVSQGIPDSRISIVSYGKERPIAVCSNASCWSQNRRAVTIVSGGMGV
ncbi:MAG: peptidoglycan-associated lipoprotein [Rhodobacteraceae bacterium]|nr:MAG: peptidoglycan-associated lipoprotein [Paracoccaceae bacterium]